MISKALPAIVLATSTAIAQTPMTADLPTTQFAAFASSIPFGSVPIHYQVWYSAAELGLTIGEPTRITGIAFRTQSTGQTGRTIEMEIRVANSYAINPGGVFQDNMVSNETLVFPSALGQPRQFTTPTTVAGMPALSIPFANDFVYDGESGIVFDFRIFDNGNGGAPYAYDVAVENFGGGRVVSLWNTSGNPVAPDSDQYVQRGPRVVLTFEQGVSVPFGDGCPGDGGFVPEHTTQGGLPIGGNTQWTQVLSNAPSQRSAIWMFSGNRDTWDVLTLPYTLDIIGAPNCSLLVRPALTANKMTVGGGAGAGLSTLSTPVPPVTFTGLNFFSQWLILDPNATNGVLAVSNGLWHVFG